MPPPQRDRRLRVLTLVDGIGNYGGGETLAREITMRLDQERFEPFFCVTRWEHLPEYDGALGELEAADVPFIGLERNSRVDLKAWRKLVAFGREKPISIVHAHKFGSNCWGALLRPWLRRDAFVAHEHTWSFEGQPHRRFLDRELIGRNCDAFVAVSSEDRRRMIEIEGIPEQKVRFVPNGISTPAAPSPGADFRKSLGIVADAPLVGVVATLRRQKALDVLIKATASLRELVPGIRVVIVGGVDSPKSSEEDDLRALIRDLGLTDSVTLAGRRLDIPDVLEAIDVGALSSDYEGSPLSVMEYMAASKPVVATRVGGLPDLVEDGVTGFLVEPQDPAALSAALAKLLTEPEKAREMGRAGYERRLRDFSIEGTTRQIEELYEELHRCAPSR